MMDLRNILRSNLKNIPGKRFRKKYLVIECDDWGGIRMPSGEVHKNLLRAGLWVDAGRFNYDTLETSEDLEHLFGVLESVTDSKGNHAVMTAVSNVANPDFEKIRLSGFTEYHYEIFTDTYLRYGRGKEVLDIWKQGVGAGIFIPELHGREHIAVQIWLKKLREGNKDLQIAFDNGFVSLNVSGIDPLARGFRSEFYFDAESQIPFLKQSIKEAAIIFSKIFNHQPKVFVPSNAVFHPVFEEDVANSGIKFLYVNRLMTYIDEKGKAGHKNYTSGMQGPYGLRYYTRNCVFEPSSEKYKSIDYTLMQVAAAFRWGKQVNISTHRVNFVGGIDPANREKGLTELKKLLKMIVKIWPDVEFKNSGDALEDYYNQSPASI